MLWATTGLPNGSRVMSGDFREYSDCGWVTMPSTCAYQFLQILELLKPGGTYPAMFNPETADEGLLLAPIWETFAAIMPSPLSLRLGASQLRWYCPPNWKRWLPCS